MHPDSATQHKVRDRVVAALRVFLSIALLVLVVMQVHWNDYPVRDDAGGTVMSPGLLSCLSGARITWLAVSLAASLLSMVVAAIRWRLLLGVQDIRVSVGRAINLQFVGEFFNAAIPGMVGGDLVKAYCLMKNTSKKAHVLISVFMDRLLGVCAMAVTALVMLLIMLARTSGDASLLSLSAPSVAVVCAAICTAIAFLFNPRLRELPGLRRLYAKLAIAKHIEHAGDAMRLYHSRPRVLVSAFLLSLVAQALNTAFVLCIGAAIGLNVAWTHYFLHVPLIMIISAVPLTPGGIGLLEQLYLIYFAAAGSPTLVLAMAVLVRAVTILSDLPGGLITLLSGISIKKVRREETI